MTHPFTLLREATAACQAFNIAPTRFGREAVNDPRLIAGLRSGRELRGDTEARVRAYLASLKEGR